MRTLFFLNALLISFFLQAQGSISGNFSPPKDFKWLIAYKLTPSGQSYITDTSVTEGSFELKMPITAQPGIYRIVYAVPQDEFFIDIIYNKKEEVNFNFSLEEGVTFTSSEENIWYNEYLSKIGEAQEKLMAFYESEKSSETEFLSLVKNINAIQNLFETKKEGTIANILIKANKNFLPSTFTSLENLLTLQKQHYFDAIDFNDQLLQGSTLLTDKITKYVFSAVSTNLKSQEDYSKEVLKNITSISAKIEKSPLGFQVKIFNELWQIANANSLDSVADSIFSSHLKDVAIRNGNEKLVNEIESVNRLKLGAPCPEIYWESDGQKQFLSKMEEAQNYVIIFWSSTCSHCLKEIPVLHNELKNYPNVKVIAVGLEDEKQNWEKESSKMPSFEHGLSLGKWESEYVKIFNIEKTPTYFILDSAKKFVAKPSSNEEVVDFFRK